MEPEPLRGLDLSARFYRDVVRPCLDAHAPGVAHAAALIGPGSEVLGCDDAISTDHDWGLRVQIFVAEGREADAQCARIDAMLRAELPAVFLGRSTHFGPPDADGVRLPSARADARGPIDHRVEVTTAARYASRYLGVDVERPWTAVDWLLCSEHKLLTLTEGRVYHDGVGALTALRARLSAHPDPVWRYIMAAHWASIAEEEPFVGRAGDVGDALGSRVIAARLVHTMMRLAFALERRYAPYSKWLGTCFRRLSCAHALEPLLTQALEASAWRDREAALCAAGGILIGMHNAALGVRPPLDPAPRPFHGRPYRVLGAHRVAAQLMATLDDATLRGLRHNVGAVHQLARTDDIVSDASFCADARALIALRAQGAQGSNVSDA